MSSPRKFYLTSVKIWPRPLKSAAVTECSKTGGGGECYATLNISHYKTQSVLELLFRDRKKTTFPFHKAYGFIHLSIVLNYLLCCH